MTAMIDGIFDVEPFKSYKEYFTIYIVCAVSKEEGISTPDNSVDNSLGTFADSNGNIIIPSVHRYANKALKGEVGGAVFAFVNTSGVANKAFAMVFKDDRYADIAVMAMPSKDYSYSVEVGLHELAHAFGHIADEYVLLQQGPTENDVKILTENHSKGYHLNVSATNDPTKVPWAHFIGHPKYPHVGVYEGALHAKGMWRSELSSAMGDSFYVNGSYYFNAICREMIVKRIKKIAGEEYSFEEFVAKDKYEPNLNVSWWY